MELVQQLTQRTTLAMTPRMQASLKILQMNNVDLSAYLAEQALENPCLNVDIPDLPSFPKAAAGPDWDVVAELESDKPGLFAHIAEQIEQSFDHPRQKSIAYAFLEALEPTGWLGSDVATIAFAKAVPEAEAETILSRLQQLEPSGIFARSLAECLRLQAQDDGVLTWELEALIENLPLLAEGKMAKLAAICDCEVEDIPEILAILRRFDPKPGLSFVDDHPPVFPPDLTVRKHEGDWLVELNRSNLPAVRIRDDGLPPVRKSDGEAWNFRMRAMSEARWLAQALARRQSTLLKTASVIVAHQTEFLDHGLGHLHPLSLEDVGGEIDMHPSTISRAIAGRMIDTPMGAIPLKNLLSRAFVTADGTEQSQDAAIQLVRRIVAAEDTTRPLSDTAIAKAASGEGVALARRTVAKYRALLGIASSYDRRAAVSA